MYNSNIITVSGLNMYLKSLFDSDKNLENIFVEGEISNLTMHYKSGHIYFSLKDEKSVIRAVMFANNAYKLKFVPKEGMKVICRGRVSVYEASGQYQVYVEDMQPDGVGALSVAFEQLKRKLENEGLFKAEHKKQIPVFPQKIGVITSKTGAAVRDILSILERRYPIADVILAPVLVQGDTAACDICKALKLFNKLNAADVIIISRGGGSAEDLQAFNDELLARTVFSSKIPVISAVGHETDFTICDFVADLRAPTPSAAAELAVPDKQELFDYIASCRYTLTSLAESKLYSLKKDTDILSERLNRNSPYKKAEYDMLRLKALTVHLNGCMDSIMSEKIKCNTVLAEKLEALSPLKILLRGYSITSKNGKTLCSPKDVSIGDDVDIRLAHGSIKCRVLKTEGVNGNE